MGAVQLGSSNAPNVEVGPTFWCDVSASQRFFLLLFEQVSIFILFYLFVTIPFGLIGLAAGVRYLLALCVE